MMKKIHCLNAISKYGTDLLTEDYELTERLEEADGILVRSAAMHEMELPYRLLAVARAGAGVNNIPLEKCAEKGVVVFNTPGANANGVKELVLASLILASRDVIGGIQWCQSIKDDPDIAKTVEKGKKAFAGREIRGKKLGVIGLGAIGAEVANAAASLGMEVLGYDPFISVSAAWMLSRDVRHITDIDAIYSECDYITVHVPLLDSTRHMLGAEEIARMKKDAVIINTARGGLVDDVALVQAVRTGKLAGAGVDVVEQEPLPVGHPLLTEPNIIVTPHIGGGTADIGNVILPMLVQDIQNFVAGKFPAHVVNKDYLSSILLQA